MRSSAPLERVRALVREHVPRLDHDRYLAPDIAAIAELVRSATVTAATQIDLPRSEGSVL